MDKKRHIPGLTDRLRSPIDPLELYNRLARALNQPLVSDPWRVVEQEFPSINGPDFREKYLLKEVLRKYPGWELGIDTERAALDSLDEAEVANRSTNDRLSSPTRASARVRKVLRLAARKASKILGRFDWDLFREGLRFGPKATAEHKGDLLLVKKLTERSHVTAAAYQLAVEVLRSCPMWAMELDSCLDWSQLLYVREYDCCSVVPKNAKTGRVILIQPGMSVMLQLATGYCIRTQLLKAGIVLNDQRINQRLAREASIDGRMATVDVRNASNSLTCGLVWFMVGDHPAMDHSSFDPTWYRLLDAIRTTHGMVDGTLREWEMFSAMGNGSTFELETLLFYCLAWAVCVVLGIPPEVSVYGDDIVLPVGAISLFRRVMSYAGFRLNMDKSFWGESPHKFRESCGGHYLDGKVVTPFYVDTPLDSATTVILLMNNIKRWAHNGSWGLDGRLQPVWEWLYTKLPKAARQSAIPLGEENDGLIKDFDVARPSCVRDGLKERRWKDYPPRWRWSKDTLEIRNEFLPREVILPKLKVPIALGYRATVWSVENRPAPVSDDIRNLVWHYLRSYRKVELEEMLPPGLRSRLKRLGYSGGVVPEPYTPYKASGEKLSPRVGTRVVATWRNTGPWMV